MLLIDFPLHGYLCRRHSMGDYLTQIVTGLEREKHEFGFGVFIHLPPNDSSPHCEEIILLWKVIMPPLTEAVTVKLSIWFLIIIE